jgi:ATP-dependent DNA ligase
VLLDGEIVVLSNGIPSFAALAERMHVRESRRADQLPPKAPATFIAFDALRMYGVDLTTRAWQERREALGAARPLGRRVAALAGVRRPRLAGRGHREQGWRAWSPSAAPPGTTPASAARTG